MIKCPACNSDNPEGSLVCAVCNTPFHATTMSTRALSVPVSGVEGGDHTAHIGKLSDRSVAIYAGDSQVPLIITIKDRVTLGRRKDIPGPDLVDLSPYDAYRLGVSRNHAVLTYKDDRLYIQDTGSVNGTWLDGQRLKPYELYAIPSGASVAIGQLIIFIYY